MALQSSKRFSFLGLTFAVIVTALGSPILSLPNTAREIGPWPAVVLLMLVAVINSEVARLMSETCAELEEKPRENDPREPWDHLDSDVTSSSSPKSDGTSDTRGEVSRWKDEREPLLEDLEKCGPGCAGNQNRLQLHGFVKDSGNAPNGNITRHAPHGGSQCSHFDEKAAATCHVATGKEQNCEGKKQADESAFTVDSCEENEQKSNGAFAVDSYGKYLGVVFKREKTVLVIARAATYVGYFALMVVDDILLTRIFLQVVEQIKWVRVNTWTLKLYFSSLVLLPLHLWQSASSESARTFVTTTLAEGVPYVFVVIVCLLVYELWLQGTGDRAGIVRWLADEGERRPTSTSALAISFPIAWHTPWGLLGLRVQDRTRAEGAGNSAGALPS
ncbi:unnamed protein product, partial [Amoebophrya sp. A25]|eukprot:GSA25T00027369001.1